MKPALHITTTVPPGKRLQIDVPDLAVGQSVEVFLVPTQPSTEQRSAFWEFLQSQPSRRTAEEWEQFDREFRAERDSWDR